MPTPIPFADDGGTPAWRARHALPPHHAFLSGVSCSPLPRCRPCWRSWQRRPGWPGCASRALWAPGAVIALAGIAALAAIIRRHTGMAPLGPRFIARRAGGWLGLMWVVFALLAVALVTGV